MRSRSCSRWDSGLPISSRISIIGSNTMEGWILVCPLAKCGGSHAYVVHSAIVFSISMHGKHNRRVDDCFGKLRSRNFVQTVPLSSNFVLREWVLPRLLARANMDPGSRKESRLSISSGVIQNDFSASMLDMVLQIFLSMKPWTSSFVFLHSANQMLNIVLLFILKKRLWYIWCCIES